MKYSAASRIVGFDFLVKISPARKALPGGTLPVRPVFLCTGIHNLYGYKIVSYNENEGRAIKGFVDHNYREISQIIIREQGNRCMGCGRELIGRLEIDHIVMRSHVRVDTRDNLRALGSPAALGGCGCHQSRHTVPGWEPIYTLESLREVIDAHSV